MPTKDVVQKRREQVAIFLIILGKTGVLEKIEGSGSNYILIVEGVRLIVERMLDNQHIMALVALVEELPENELSVGFLIKFTNLAGVNSIFRSSDIVGYPIKQVTHDFFARLGSDAEKKQFAIDSSNANIALSDATARLNAKRALQNQSDEFLNSRYDDLKRIDSEIKKILQQKIECSNKLEKLADFELALSKLKRIFVGNDDVMRTSVPISIPSLTVLENQISQLDSRLEVLQQERAHAENLVSEAVFEKKHADSAFRFVSQKVQKAENHVREILLDFNRRKLGLK